MPRIVPLQLLKCLKVLLDDNGGILSESEVKRIAGLMTKYSKKLVSKCIYVQILKCTKTELLGEFMGAGGWTLVHMWLNDAIRAMNWPLVQEILELLLLCPVDVDRLKSNSAPKLVRGLCKDGGIEGVRILAKRLVEQWLKVVTADSSVTASSANNTINSSTTPTTTNTPGMPPQSVTVDTPAVATTTIEVKTAEKAAAATTPTTTTTSPIKERPDTAAITAAKPRQVSLLSTQKERNDSETSKQYDDEEEERDPLADVPNDVLPVPSYGLTPAQKKASEAGLVYKIVLKDGQQVLKKVDPTAAAVASTSPPPTTTTAAAALSLQRQTKKQTKIEKATRVVEENEEDEESTEADEEVEDDEEEENREPEQDAEAPKQKAITKNVDRDAEVSIIEDGEQGPRKKREHDALLKNSKNSEVTSVERVEDSVKTLPVESPELLGKAVSKNENDKIIAEEIKAKESPKDRIGKKLEERSGSRDSKDSKDKEGKEKSEKDKERRSSSSSNHKSSSSSSSSNSKSSSKVSASSSSKSKSSSSTSSDRRSSNDKYRSSEKDKDRSGSSKSKDRSSSNGNGTSSSTGSSSSSKTKSSSSKSSSSSASSKDHRPRDKERDKTSSLSSTSSSPTSASAAIHKKDKDNIQTEKDKEGLFGTSKQMSIDKLGRIPKKSKPSADSAESSPKRVATSITIPSKKASMSIEIRRDSEKAKTVKTYKSQFRSHGLTEEAPPPPSRKGLKKPSSATTPGTSIPLSLPSSMKRSSPPHNRGESPVEKKSKIDINNVGNTGSDKPGAIKLIAPKKIATLIETNIFSDALSAATGPKKPVKRKRPVTPKVAQSPPTSPEAPKVTPLKFYQDTLDESNKDDSKELSATEGQKSETEGGKDKEDNSDKDNGEDDDDIPLKKVKEDIEQQVLKEQKATAAAGPSTETASGDNDEANSGKSKADAADDGSSSATEEPRKPGPGCGPNGPPGVLTLHRRKGPKKKLSWRPQEQLEQIRYFELDETERVNVTKTFMDMKNMERFSERESMLSRRGFNHEDNMEPQIAWKPLVEIDGVPPHPDGNQSKERKVQADREQMTLRALYFSRAMIPDSPAEAEFEPHYAHDIPVIPLDDITGNPDAVNDFTSMRWPDPKGSPKQGESTQNSNATDMFNGAPFNPFISPYVPPSGAPPGIPSAQQQQNMSAPPPMQMVPPPGVWSGQGGRMPIGSIGGPGSNFNGPLPGSPTVENMGPMGPGGPMTGPPPNFIGGRNQFVPPGPQNQFGPGGQQFGPPPGYNGPPNFGPLGPAPLMNGLVPGPHMGVVVPLMNGPTSRPGSNRGGGNWRGANFDNNGGAGSGGNGGGNWRPAGSGQNRNDWTNNSGNGVCKAYMRGHCRLGKSCKYMHPKKKRL